MDQLARACDVQGHSPPAPDASRADWAHFYSAVYGFHLVPDVAGEKRPKVTAWPHGAISSPEKAVDHWQRFPKDNMGVLLGASGLVSLNIEMMLEAEEALKQVGIDLEDYLLCSCQPMITGYPERVRLMFSYHQGAPLPIRRLCKPSANLSDDAELIFELRSGQMQDVVPPSGYPAYHTEYFWVNEWWT